MRSRLTDTHVDNLMLIAMKAPNLQSRPTDADGITQLACEDFAHRRGRHKLHSANSTVQVSCTHFFQAPAFAARKLSEVFVTPGTVQGRTIFYERVRLPCKNASDWDNVNSLQLRMSEIKINHAGLAHVWECGRKNVEADLVGEHFGASLKWEIWIIFQLIWHVHSVEVLQVVSFWGGLSRIKVLQSTKCNYKMNNSSPSRHKRDVAFGANHKAVLHSVQIGSGYASLNTIFHNSWHAKHAWELFLKNY